MPTLTITRGLPASGKTTWARQHAATTGAARVNRDDLRAMMFDQLHGLTWEEEKAVTDAARAQTAAHLNAGRDVVADDMNLRPRYVREWRALARLHGADLVVHAMPDTDPDECTRRDAARGGKVGETAIRALAAKYLRGGTYLPVPDDHPDPRHAPYAPAPGTPAAVMVDIDGTLAARGDRSPFDWGRVAEDTPVEAVVVAVRAARDAGYRIIFCSGRSDECRRETREWLAKYAGHTPSEPLLMRAADDMRKDAVVKLELFDRHVRDSYNVRYVLDDRQQVVDAWRSIGLTVFQVAEGNF